MKIIRKIVNEDIKLMNTDKRYIHELKPLILGENPLNLYNKIVISEDGLLWMLVDEEGFSKNLPLNIYLYYPELTPPVSEIVGDILFVRIKEPDFEHEVYDYEIDDLREMDFAIIQEVLERDEVVKQFIAHEQRKEKE